MMLPAILYRNRLMIVQLLSVMRSSLKKEGNNNVTVNISNILIAAELPMVSTNSKERCMDATRG